MVKTQSVRKKIRILILFLIIIETSAIGLGFLFLHIVTTIESDISMMRFLQKAECVWTSFSIIWGTIGVLSVAFIGSHAVASILKEKINE